MRNLFPLFLLVALLSACSSPEPKEISDGKKPGIEVIKAFPKLTGPKIQIKFRPVAGRTYRYLMKAQTESTGGTSDRSTTSCEMDVSVKDANGKKKLTTQTTKLKVEAVGPNKKATEDLYKDFKYVTTVGTYDDLANPTGLAVTCDPSKGARLVASSLASGLKGLNLGFMNLVLPSDPVQIGSTWQTPVSYGSILSSLFDAGSVKVEGGELPAVYELIDIDKTPKGDVANIRQTIQGTVKLTLQRAVKNFAPGDQTIVNLNSVTNIQADLQTGLVIAYTQETVNETTFKSGGEESKTKQTTKTVVAMRN